MLFTNSCFITKMYIFKTIIRLNKNSTKSMYKKKEKTNKRLNPTAVLPAIQLAEVQRAATASEVSVQPEGVVRGRRHHAHPLVLAHPLLKEVGLSLQGDVLHEVKRVLHSVDLHTETPCQSAPPTAPTLRSPAPTPGRVQIGICVALPLSVREPLVL